MAEAALKKDIFALHTSTGFEQEIQELIATMLPDIAPEDHFVPQRMLYYRIRRQWHKQVRDLFPGYVFIRSEDPEQLFYDLKRIPRFKKLLQYDEESESFIPLSEQECKFIELLCSVSLSELRTEKGAPTKFIVPCSRVEIIPKDEARPGDVIRPRSNPEEVLRVIDGPLVKLDPYVSYIDFNTRSAVLDRTICGEHKIHIGIRLPKDRIIE